MLDLNLNLTINLLIPHGTFCRWEKAAFSQTGGESEHNRSCQIAEFDAFFGENFSLCGGQAIIRKKPQFLLLLLFLLRLPAFERGGALALCHGAFDYKGGL